MFPYDAEDSASRHAETAAAIAEAEARGRKRGLEDAAAMLRERAAVLRADAARIYRTNRRITDAVRLIEESSTYTRAAEAVADMIKKEPA